MHGASVNKLHLLHIRCLSCYQISPIKYDADLIRLYDIYLLLLLICSILDSYIKFWLGFLQKGSVAKLNLETNVQQLNPTASEEPALTGASSTTFTACLQISFSHYRNAMHYYNNLPTSFTTEKIKDLLCGFKQ